MTNPLIPIATLGAFLLFAGCASRPKYGAAPRHKHGCDCPKWNAVPPVMKKDVRVAVDDGMNDDLSTVTGHGGSN